MKASKSVSSLTSQQHQMQAQANKIQRSQPQPPDTKNNSHQSAASSTIGSAIINSAPTSPICRCRVMYLGSSVPHITKDGLQGIQEPLRELYPDQKTSLNSANAGIDSWLSVWSNGILIENVDETGRELKRFFKIEALHYCAAVKYVPQAINPNPNSLNTNATLPNNLSAMPKFLPLDSPHARMQQDINTNPPIFASILRRTTGVKVLECHAFICKREAAANALVRCCFHAYADTMYAKQIGADIDSLKQIDNNNNNKSSNGSGGSRELQYQNGTVVDNRQQPGAIAATRRSKSIAALNNVGDNGNISDYCYLDNYNNQDYSNMRQPIITRRKSLNNGQLESNYPNQNNLEGDISDSGASQHQIYEANSVNQFEKQTKRFSKSMHHLNQSSHQDYMVRDDGSVQNQRTTPDPSQIFTHNPYASRVPSYPPQNILDQQQQQLHQHQHLNGGTLRSVKSVAANSIASTLLRSKKHAKAMSMAQLNSQQQQQQQQHQNLLNNQPMSFHQHPQAGAKSSFMTLPPVPPMFLANVPRSNLNGSQTMKLPSRRNVVPGAGLGPNGLSINFEAMTPKEMKKLLKKSAKYGIDPSKFADNGLPLMPIQPLNHSQQQAMFSSQLNAKSGTFNSNTLVSMNPADFLQHLPPQPGDMVDFSGQPPLPNMQLTRAGGGPMFLSPDHLGDMQQQPIKSILVKPNPEFLKSKAGKKWLKQQKEFKKLLPAHLDGLPIVFGPPPIDALETANGPASSSTMSVAPLMPPTQPLPAHLIQGSYVQHQVPPPMLPGPHQSGSTLPVLDSNGFYNPHLLYGPSGRASAASTLLRNSPQIQKFHDEQLDYLQRNHPYQQSMYSNPMQVMGQHPHHNLMVAPPPPLPPPMLPPQHQQQADDLYGQRPPPTSRPPIPFEHGQFQSADSTRRRRNQMVEQSVISLGDEENEDDVYEVQHHGENNDGQEVVATNRTRTRHRLDEHASNHNDDHHQLQQQQRQHHQQTNGYYNQVQTQSNGHHPQHRRRRKSLNEQVNGYQDDYEQINEQMPNEEMGGNSSGIYRRRGHMNERAFSYSIRQEANKSSAENSDAEYRNGELSDSNYQLNSISNNKGTRNNNQLHHGYDRPQQQDVYSSRSQMQYYNQQQQQQQQQQQTQQHQHQHQQPVDELTARLENQLNMKSFANSCVKSHM